MENSASALTVLPAAPPSAPAAVAKPFPPAPVQLPFPKYREPELQRAMTQFVWHGWSMATIKEQSSVEPAQLLEVCRRDNWEALRDAVLDTVRNQHVAEMAHYVTSARRSLVSRSLSTLHRLMESVDTTLDRLALAPVVDRAGNIVEGKLDVDMAGESAEIVLKNFEKVLGMSTKILEHADPGFGAAAKGGAPGAGGPQGPHTGTPPAPAAPMVQVNLLSAARRAVAEARGDNATAADVRTVTIPVPPLDGDDKDDHT